MTLTRAVSQLELTAQKLKQKPKLKQSAKTPIQRTQQFILHLGLSLLLLMTSQLSMAKVMFQFDQVSRDQGLTNAWLLDVKQSQDGYLWLASQNGLFRYDGYDFKVFMHDPQDPSSLAGNYIQHLFEDSQGYMWVSTPPIGLSRYDPKTESFTNFSQANGLNAKLIMSVAEDKDGDIWIATLGGGLNKLDPRTNTISHFRHDPTNPNSLGDDNIYTVYVDSQGILWLGTRGAGLNSFDKSTGQFTHYQHDSADLNSLSHNKVSSILESSDGSLWVGTRGGGLNRYDPNSQRFERFEHEDWNPDSLSDDEVFTIFEDLKGSLWIGTNGGGLNRFIPSERNFVRYQHHPQNPHSLASNTIRSISQDQNGLIWIATFGGGLSRFDPASERFNLSQHDSTNTNSLASDYILSIHKDRQGSIWSGSKLGLDQYDPQSNQYRHISHDPDDPNSLSGNDVRSILEDAAGNLWVGTMSKGLNQLSPKAGFNLSQSTDFKHYRHDPNDPHSLSNDSILVIHQDTAGTLWIGTQNGLNRFNPKTNNFTRYKTSATNTVSDGIYSLYTAPDGILWIGTHGVGLNRFDPSTEQFSHYRHNPNDSNSLSNDSIYAIEQDPQGNLWLGTDGGLNKFDFKNRTISHIRSQHGLSGNRVSSIASDQQGNLWLGLINGITFYNPTTKLIKNHIGINAGCLGISQGAFFKASDGQLFFGNQGYCAFYPEQAIRPSQPPTVAFTDFRLLNRTVAVARSPDSTSPLSRAINYTDALTLSHEDNVLSFEFAALHYVHAEQNQYQYKLDGFNHDWITTGVKNRRATYTNLPAGKYTFRVKASNSEGLWNQQERTIKLIIEPAPWFSWWAYASYLLLICAIAAAILQQRNQKRQALILAKNNAEQARKNAELAQHHAEKANQTKSLFVADVSHEIRTPLNAVLGYSQLLERDPTLDEQYKRKIRIIEQSSDHLLGLINNILDISKIEANAMTLLTDDFELVEVVESIALMLGGRCDEKNLQWQFINNCHQCIAVHGDQVKLRQVLINLLGNAVKFTEQGSVTLTLSVDATDHYRFEVADTGAGIAIENQQKIFQAFAQTNEGARQGGTGLGLAIANKQVSLMGGELQLISHTETEAKKGQTQGSRFFFTLPLLPAHKAIKTRCSEQTRAIKLPPNTTVRALVVEDIEASSEVLKQVLQHTGIEVTEAVNGQEALNQLHQADILPDLIFLDIQMPVMDGVTALKHIQRHYFNPITSDKTATNNNRPKVIAITAHAMQQEVDNYLVQGFDHYIAKPYRFETIYECLAQLLDVDFHYLDQPEPQKAKAEVTVHSVADQAIPIALFKALEQQAFNCEISKLESSLTELGKLNQHSLNLANQLKAHICNYDMEGFLSELQRLGSDK